LSTVQYSTVQYRQWLDANEDTLFKIYGNASINKFIFDTIYLDLLNSDTWDLGTEEHMVALTDLMRRTVLVLLYGDRK